MARIYKREKTWYVDYVDKGRRRRVSLAARNKAAAEAARAQIELTLAQGKSPAAEMNYPLADVAQAYLKYCAGRNRPTTTADKVRYCQRFAAYFGVKRGLGDVARADVEDYVTARVAAAAGSAVINRELTTLKHFFNFALNRGLVESNPCKGIKLLAEERRPIKILSRDELTTFLDWCEKHDPLLFDVCTIAYHTALRRSDILKIRGEDVDVKRQTLAVSISKRNREAVLYLPLNADALAVLRTRKALLGDGYLFPGDGKPYAMNIKKHFAWARAATGIQFRFMEFRHNCATALLTAGVDIYTVKEILGHTNITTTARYLALVGESKRAALDKLTGGRRKASKEKSVGVPINRGVVN